MVAERTHVKNGPTRGRGRPRKVVTQNKPHAGRPLPQPPLLPVSRRSSRRPRQQLREDFYNVDGIVVEDEEDEYLRREKESEEEMVEKVVAMEEEEDDDEEEEDFKSKKKLKLLLKLDQNPQTKAEDGRRSGSGLFSSVEHGSGRGGGRRNDADANEIRHPENASRRLGSNCRTSTSGTGTPLPDSKTLVLILDKIQKKDKYGVFAEPVDAEELPDYHEVIKHPMDFGTIRKKLARNMYSNLEQFESDVLLVCSNAMQYNSPETIYFKQASSMQELAKKKFQTLKDRSSSYEVILNNVQGKQLNTASTPMKNQSRAFSDKCIEHQEKLVSNRLIEEQPKSLPDKPINGRLKSLSNKFMEDQSKSVAEKPIQNHVDRSTEKSTCSSPKPQAASIDSHDTNFISNSNAGNEMKITEYIGSDKPENFCASMASSVHHQDLSEKAEEPSEKSFLLGYGQKPSSLDEDRRATYTKSSNQTTYQSNPLFTTFESEKKLVAVGLHDESSYARSLARFSATLGPIAWKIASKNIEKALPVGLKFGPGWVGEYEPPLSPIFSCENNFQQVSSYSRNSYPKTASEKEKNNSDDPKAKEDNILQNGHADTFSNGHTTEVHYKPTAVGGGIFSNNSAEGKQALFGFPLGRQPPIGNETLQQQRDRFADYAAKIYTSKQAMTDVSTYTRNVSNYVDGPTATHPGCSDVVGSRCMDMGFKNTSNMIPSSYEKPANSMLKAEKTSTRAGDLPEQLDSKNSSERKFNGTLGFIPSSQAGIMSNSNALAPIDQKIDDPVKSLRMFPGNVQNYPNTCLTDTTKRFISPALSARNQTGATLISTSHTCMPVRHSAEHQSARTYMDGHTWTPDGSSAELESTRTLDTRKLQTKTPTTKPTWMFQHSTSGAKEVGNRMPMPQLPSKPTQMVVKDQGFQNKCTVAFPQVFSSDFPRFHGQSPWQGIVQHSQQSQRHGMLPPDLNIGCQPPGSPVQQSSGILVDSQQPDLALQL